MSNFDWMKKSVGVSFHWTPRDGFFKREGTNTFEEAVNAFDTERFAETVAKAGADHVIFTLAHADQMLAFPCKTLDKILPGRTTKRDLISEIIASLKKRNIRFIAYYNHSCNNKDDLEWKEACGYAAGKDGDLDLFADNICAIVSEISQRYGKGIDGWWFDSGYSLDNSGFHKWVTCDMGDWKFPWDRLVDSAKSGNKNSAVSINSGEGRRFLYTKYQDYYAGETVSPTDVFVPEKDPTLDMIDHRWMTLDNAAWLFNTEHENVDFKPTTRFSDEVILDFVKNNLANDTMTTFNIEISRDVVINPVALGQFAKIKSQI